MSNNDATALGNYRSSVSITIRVDLLQQADKIAEEEGISRSALFELAVREYIETYLESKEESE